jgi:hypothetical protein
MKAGGKRRSQATSRTKRIASAPKRAKSIRWSEWLEGLRITHEEDGSTVLTGQVADQPALHGLLIKIRDLGAPLVSVNVLGSGDMDHTEPNRKEPHRRAGEDGWLD